MKKVTKSFLLSNNVGGFFVLRGRTLREAVSKALTPRGDFRHEFEAGTTVDTMMENIADWPTFESEAWIWPIEWNEEQRKNAMRH